MKHIFPTNTQYRPVRKKLSNPKVTIKLLELAYKLIEQGDMIYVCNAVKYAKPNNLWDKLFNIFAHNKARNELVDIITRVAGGNTVIYWYYANVDRNFDTKYPEHNSYRLAWIASMIAIIKETDTL